MKTLGDFLDRLLKDRGLNPTDAANISKVKGCEFVPQSISQAISGKRGLDPETIEKLAKAISLTEQETNKLLLLSYAHKESKNHASLERISAMIASIDKNGTLNPASSPIETTVTVWLNIQAGAVKPSERNATAYGVTEMTESEIREGFFCMLVNGNSMEKELVFDGDYAIFSPNNQGYSDRDIYAVEVEGYPLWLIKKVRKLPGGRLALASANDKDEPIVVDPEATKVAFKGRMVRNTRVRGNSIK